MYHTAVHSSTGTSPFELMFHQQSKLFDFDHQLAFDDSSYQSHFKTKLTKLRDLMETNLAEAVTHQKTTYDKHSSSRTFKAGNPVWLSVPIPCKLDSRWERNWKITAIKGPVTMRYLLEIETKVTNINRLHHRIQPSPHETTVILDFATD